MSKHNGRLMRMSDDEIDAHDMEDDDAPPSDQRRAEVEREFLDRNSAVVMDEEDVARRAYREAALRGIAKFKGVFASIYGFQGDRRFAMDCAVAALGFLEILRVKDLAQLAERRGYTKANVVKLVKQIQRENDLPPTSNQREESGCKSMRVMRKGQTVSIPTKNQTL